MSQVELRIESISTGKTRRWALYVVPCTDELEVERVECQSLDELDGLLTKLRRSGVSESVLLKARAVVVERNAPYVLGAYQLLEEDRQVLGLEPVHGVTRSDLDDFPLPQGEGETQ
jgi:hypothetical protein